MSQDVSGRPAETVQRHVGGLLLRERTAPDARGTLFYIHGLGESGLCFEALMAAPALAGFRHLALDLPGYGKSAWQAPPEDFASCAVRLAAWLGEHHAEPVVVVGHSMGGVLGTMLAVDHPQRVAALVNVEGNVSRHDCTQSLEAACLDRRTFLEKGGFGQLAERVYENGIVHPAERGYYASLRMCDPRQLHRDAVELVALSTGETLAARMAAVGRPKVYLLGNPDGTGTVSRALLDAAGVRWQAIEDAGHWPYLDQPESFVDALASFLGRAL